MQRNCKSGVWDLCQIIGMGSLLLHFYYPKNVSRYETNLMFKIFKAVLNGKAFPYQSRFKIIQTFQSFHLKAAFGGLVGLCTGSSFLSAAELVYFFTLRCALPICRKRRQVRIFSLFIFI